MCPHTQGCEVYAPPMPSLGPPAFLAAVRALYVIPPRVVAANRELLPGQDIQTGGAATLPPQAPSVQARMTHSEKPCYKFSVSPIISV